MIQTAKATGKSTKVKGSMNKNRVQTNSDDTTNPYYTDKAFRNVHIL